MQSTLTDSSHVVAPLPRWALVVIPLLVVVIAAADFLFIALEDPDGWGQHSPLGLGTTIPVSLGLGAMALWLLVRSRRASIRLAAAEHEHALRSELDHRVRNNLAGLVGLVSLYERSGRSASELAQALRGKILALKEVHDTINRTAEGDVDLASLVMRVCDAVVPGARRASIEAKGPGVTLTTGEGTAMAMTIQELLTNSLKHGALAAPDGQVSVRWSTSPAEEGVVLDFVWSESPLPQDTRPTTPGSGIGLTLIEGFARSDLRGDISFARGKGDWTVRLWARLATPPALRPVRGPGIPP